MVDIETFFVMATRVQKDENSISSEFRCQVISFKAPMSIILFLSIGIMPHSSKVLVLTAEY